MTSEASSGLIGDNLEIPLALPVLGLARGGSGALGHWLIDRCDRYGGRTRRAIRAPCRIAFSSEQLAIATGAGSLEFSHVNDGGFWLVKDTST